MGYRDAEIMSKMASFFQQEDESIRRDELDLREIRAGEGRSLRTIHDLILFEPAGPSDSEASSPQIRTLYDRFAAGPKATRREMPMD